VTDVYVRAARATSSLLCAYLGRIGSSLRVGIALPEGPAAVGASDSLDRFVRIQQAFGPAIYTLWTNDQINLLSMGFSSRSYGIFARRFEYFADDSFGGVVMQTAIAKLGAPVIAISERDAAARLRVLKEVVSSRPSAFLVVDGRGPYFSVGTGIVNLASTMKATIVPCAVASWPHLAVRGRSARVQIPLPRSRVLLWFGAPLTFDARQPGARASSEARVLCSSLLALGSATSKACRAAWPEHACE
jgi:lysophospholipid acyltransferase (LPLAT)-like uncharacterized protein